uniref:DUF1664 domain-containing protein n=1 Tax=Tetraselmis sp. GSL018 TaxID=582737 RepID=A0A061RWC3_9CHLO|mmetsp:Transcript_17031/g.40633  ORF Transcript_17031/g.40633 Transcript_17031/m.40633 type:complete len:275 (+) Transcript_17031:226-1050(+)
MAAALLRGVYMLTVGAAGAYVFQNAEKVNEVLSEVSRAVVHTLSKPSSWKLQEGASQDPNGAVAVLSRQVDDLTRELRRLASQNPSREITFVHPQQQSAGARAVQLSVLVGGSYLVLRLRGYSLRDFMYVTRASLNQSISSVNSGLDGLKSRLQAVRSQVEQQLRALSEKHDQTASEIKGQIRNEISMVQAQISEIGDAQSYANQGIFLLSRVVAEVLGPSNSSAARELEAFARTRPSLISGQPNGLRALVLDDANEADLSAVLVHGPSVRRTF